MSLSEFDKFDGRQDSDPKNETLCPSCIIEYANTGKEFGDEGYHRLELGTEYKLCSQHSQHNLKLATKIADRILDGTYDTSE